MTDTTGTEAGAVNRMEFPDGAVTISGNTAIVVIGGAGLETDPVYSLWNKSTGISITNGQVSNWSTATSAFLTSYNETDPIAMAAGFITSTGTATNFSGSLAGDVTGTQGITIVGDDSHAHTGSTISGLGTSDFTSTAISQWYNDSDYQTTSGTVTNFTGSLLGDVTGTQGITVVGDDSHAHTASTISGLSPTDFTTTIISQWFNDADYQTTAGTVTNFTGSLAGDVTGTQGITVVGDDSHNHTASTISGLSPTDFTTTIVSQWFNDAGYQTTAGTVTNFTGSLSGDVTGTQGETIVGNDSHSHGDTTISITNAAVKNWDVATSTFLTTAVESLNTLTGDVTLNAGDNITITSLGTSITVAVSGLDHADISDFNPSVTTLVEAYSYLTDAVTSINGMTDATQTFAAGSNITITSLNGTTTIASTASGGGVESINSLTGAIDIVAGSNVTITSLGTTVTVSATGGGGVDTVVAGESISVSGATGDVTVSVVKEVDLVAGDGLDGGANDILPGSDADITVSVLASDSTITVTASGIAVGTLADSNIPDAITLSSSATVDAGAIKSGTIGIARLPTYTDDFVSGDLSSSKLTVTHNIGTQYVHVTVYDNGNDMVIPTNIDATSTVACEVDLTGFTVTGTWNVRVDQ